MMAVSGLACMIDVESGETGWWVQFPGATGWGEIWCRRCQWFICSFARHWHCHVAWLIGWAVCTQIHPVLSSPTGLLHQMTPVLLILQGNFGGGTHQSCLWHVSLRSCLTPRSLILSQPDMPHAALTIQHAAAMTRFAAKQLTKCALPYGAIGVRSAVYFLSMFLTMFMNNSATVAPRPNWSQHPQN